MQPPSPDRHLVTPADLAACRQMIRDGSKTFYTASLLLPQRICDAGRALYAFCRVADDAVDQSADSRAALADLYGRLDRIYALDPADDPADRAFADVARRYAIPRAIPEALIEGFAWDATGRRYDTIGDLTAYAMRVAGTVGAMMAIIMETRDPQALARACDLGCAMQFTNIARDIGEDARNGRLYLPRDWMMDEGLDPERFLRQPSHSPQLTRVAKRLLAEADRLYERALSGIAMLPRGCRPSINAARVLYCEIGREVERNGHDSVSRRAVVPAATKLKRLATAVAESLTAKVTTNAPPLPEAVFLIEAVARAGDPPRRLKSIEERVLWAAEILSRSRIERQQG